jgi:hypothetical protein
MCKVIKKLVLMIILLEVIVIYKIPSCNLYKILDHKVV